MHCITSPHSGHTASPWSDASCTGDCFPKTLHRDIVSFSVGSSNIQSEGFPFTLLTSKFMFCVLCSQNETADAKVPLVITLPQGIGALDFYIDLAIDCVNITDITVHIVLLARYPNPTDKPSKLWSTGAYAYTAM